MSKALGFIDLMLSVVQCNGTEYTMMSWFPGVYRFFSVVQCNGTEYTMMSWFPGVYRFFSVVHVTLQNTPWWAEVWTLSIYCSLWRSVVLQITPWWTEALGLIYLLLSVVQCSVTEYTMMSWGPGFIDLLLSVMQCSFTICTMMSWGPGAYLSITVCNAV